MKLGSQISIADPNICLVLSIIEKLTGYVPANMSKEIFAIFYGNCPT
jgi:hypothetical protein